MHTFTFDVYTLSLPHITFFDGLLDSDEETAAKEANQAIKDAIDKEVDERVVEDLKEAEEAKAEETPDDSDTDEA